MTAIGRVQWLQTETSQIHLFGINELRIIQMACSFGLNQFVVELTTLKSWFTHITKKQGCSLHWKVTLKNLTATSPSRNKSWVLWAMHRTCCQRTIYLVESSSNKNCSQYNNLTCSTLICVRRTPITLYIHALTFRMFLERHAAVECHFSMLWPPPRKWSRNLRHGYLKSLDKQNNKIRG